MRKFTTAFLMLMAVTVLAGCIIAGPDVARARTVHQQAQAVEKLALKSNR
jgi:hypothetical protein